MGGKQSHPKKSKNKSSIFEKGISSEEKSVQNHRRSSIKNTSDSSKSKAKNKRSRSIPASFKRIGDSFSIVRRSRSWAIEVRF